MAPPRKDGLARRPRVFLTGASGFIGTNLVDALEGNAEIVNYDVAAPARERHRAYWAEGDILDASALGRCVAEARPHVVVHLAARSDCDENTTVEAGYA
ncbi:MAG: NAD-dependent epimerase/dehydratase family protein, partial [Gemmatimonadetes bacterium]|nr:NAD-dependent epimerase/dehydratase family protein [Gemmatimonadota bacterium]